MNIQKNVLAIGGVVVFLLAGILAAGVIAYEPGPEATDKLFQTMAVGLFFAPMLATAGVTLFVFALALTSPPKPAIPAITEDPS